LYFNLDFHMYLSLILSLESHDGAERVSWRTLDACKRSHINVFLLSQKDIFIN
jgi:hypothetical protein